MVHVISIKNELSEHYTNDSGNDLYLIIRKYFEKDEKVVVSFEGISEINSSFVNSAFVQLLETYSLNFIMEHLSFKYSNKQINHLILSRFKFESKSKNIYA